MLALETQESCGEPSRALNLLSPGGQVLPAQQLHLCAASSSFISRNRSYAHNTSVLPLPTTGSSPED